LPVKKSHFDQFKDKVLFFLSLLIAVFAGWCVFGVHLDAPHETTRMTVDRPPKAGAILEAEKVFDAFEYWNPDARFVFVKPEVKRVFVPVELEVPVMKLPKLVIPLPEPGPLAGFSGKLQRIDGSPAPDAPEAEPVDPGAADADIDAGGAE
jgi:hypothetical protein